MTWWEWVLVPPMLIIGVFVLLLWLVILVLPWVLALYYSFDIFERIEQRLSVLIATPVGVLIGMYLFIIAYHLSTGFYRLTETTANNWQGF